jgi:pyridoxamine 5'-phosphate oxidase family protein
MASFSGIELNYLNDERRLGRLATADADGLPHVVPVGMWRYNPELGTIEITGADFATSRKFRNVQENPKAAFVVDDMASIDPWRPRFVMVRGGAEAIAGTRDGGRPLIRIRPDTIVSSGLEPDPAPPGRPSGEFLGAPANVDERREP